MSDPKYIRAHRAGEAVGAMIGNALRGNEPLEKEIATLVLWLNEIAAISRGEEVPRLRRMIVRFRPAEPRPPEASSP